MSGINDLDWTPKEQMKKERKKLYIRFCLSLILSNCLVAILFYAPDETKLDQLIGHSGKKNYTKLLLPLENYVHFQDNQGEVQISLFDQQGNALITDAYLLSLARTDGEQNLFVVDIPIHQIEKLHSLTEIQRPLKAYPRDPSLSVQAGGKVYEIQF